MSEFCQAFFSQLRKLRLLLRWSSLHFIYCCLSSFYRLLIVVLFFSVLSLPHVQKSPPKKSKTSRDSSFSDDEPLETAAVRARAPRAGRAKAAVKYFEDSDDDVNDKENDDTKDWSISDSDFDEE